jgi:hypothetical protein
MSMGYEDIQVTEQSDDKGVDDVGNVQISIFSVRGVVQVKRTPNSTMSRSLIVQLRGRILNISSNLKLSKNEFTRPSAFRSNKTPKNGSYSYLGQRFQKQKYISDNYL